MMPSIVKGIKTGKLTGKAVISCPRKVCKVCGTLFDKALLPAKEKVEIKPDFCPTCKPLLDAGYVALVCGDKYALVKCSFLSDWGGTIRQIGPKVMMNVEKQFGASKRRINGDN